MNCTKCNAELTAEDNFCHNCAAKNQQLTASDEVKFSYSLLRSDEINRIINQYYGLKNCRSDLIRSKKNDVYKVYSHNLKYIFKVYNECRREEDILHEIDFTVFLEEKGVLVSVPIKTVSGNDRYVRLDFPEGERYAVLFLYIEGSELDYRKRDDCFLYGESIAKLHLASADYKAVNYNELKVEHLLYESVSVIEGFLSKYNIRNRIFFYRFFKKIIAILSEININDMLAGYIHGDLHGGNAILNGEKLFFYDFELSGHGLICYELSVFRWMTLVVGNKNQWDAFLNGYQSLIGLDDRQLKFCILMACIRDIYLFASTVELSYKFGTESVRDYYIQNRVSFYKKLESMIEY